MAEITYIAQKKLTADGVTYEIGSQVPADTWPTRHALLSLNWIAPTVLLQEESAPNVDTETTAGAPPSGQAKSGQATKNQTKRK